MNADVVSFRRSVKRTYGNQVILHLESCNSRDKAKALIGKPVEFKTETGLIIKGSVVNAHGNKGALLARFEKGMPGQALGQTVKIG